MAIDPTLATRAYQNAILRAADQGQKGEDMFNDGVGAKAKESTFADLVRGAVSDAIDTQKTSETVATKAIRKEANLVDVVTAVNNAEVTLQAVVAVRDRVINAYQEIMRMPI